MRESRTYGVVRGARGNPRPYRNPYPTASSTMELKRYDEALAKTVRSRRGRTTLRRLTIAAMS